LHKIVSPVRRYASCTNEEELRRVLAQWLKKGQRSGVLPYAGNNSPDYTGHSCIGFSGEPAYIRIVIFYRVIIIVPVSQPFQKFSKGNTEPLYDLSGLIHGIRFIQPAIIDQASGTAI
jgi:hypothetical protein